MRRAGVSACWQSPNGSEERPVTNSGWITLAIQEVGCAVVNVQDERHAAVYYNQEQRTATDVEAILKIAHLGLQHWASIRTDPMAGNYLLSMLLTIHL